MKNINTALKRKYENQVVREPRSRQNSLILVIVVIFLLSGVASCRLSDTSRWRMDGKSMEPNLIDGQIVEVEPVEDFSSLQRGDILIVEWNGNTMMKRLVALPGETIEIRPGSILINGEVYDEPYDVAPQDYEREPIKLSENEYYVLGDNRNDSRDSHNFGPITSEMIKGRVIP